MIDECACISCQTTHSHTNVLVNLCYFFNARWFLVRGMVWGMVWRTDAVEDQDDGISTHLNARSPHKHTSRGDVTRFSTARTTPSLVLMPIAVDPNCEGATVLL